MLSLSDSVSLHWCSFSFFFVLYFLFLCESHYKETQVVDRRREKEQQKTMGVFAMGSAFDSKSGQIIMAALLLMVVSFYAGTLFGNNAPLYVSQFTSRSSSSSSSSTALPSSSNGNLFSSTQLQSSFLFSLAFLLPFIFSFPCWV